MNTLSGLSALGLATPLGGRKTAAAVGVEIAFARLTVYQPPPDAKSRPDND